MNQEHGHRRLGELAWDRYCSATNDEGQNHREAFIETIVLLLQEQDAAWQEARYGTNA